MKLNLRMCFSAISAVTLAVASLLAAVPGQGHAAPAGLRYTMVAFSNASQVDLDVYESGDGTDFRPLRFSAFRAPFGLMRDPSIFRHRDGTYYLAYTTGGSGATIGLARSRDRVHWTFMSAYPVPFCCFGMPGTGTSAGSTGSAPGSAPLGSPLGSAGSAGSADGPTLSPFVTKAWAPEWFIDGDQINLIVSLSGGGGFVPYMMTALEPSLNLWSFPVPLTGIGADHIDTTIVKIGGTYHAFTKNEAMPKKIIEHAVAPTATGPYTFVPSGNWGRMREGPALTQLPNGVWRIYLDAYTEGRYFYSDSKDGLRTWSPMREIPGISGKARHFSVIREQI